MSLRNSLVGIATVAILAAACQQAQSPGTAGGGITGGLTTRDKISIEVVTHGQASDPFWSVVKNGVDAAAKDMGVKANYSAPETFDMPKMAQLIDAAVAKQPQGLIVSLPDENALGPSVQKATDAGIPVITINSGSDVFSKYGALAHVGQTEYEAGLGAGKRFAEAGVKNAVCVNQEVGNVALDLRCQGFTDGLEGSKVTVVAVSLADPAGAQQAIAAALTGDATIDGILTLGPTGAAPALKALEAAGKLGQIQFATFDLSKEVLEAIRDGNMSFAIDQQQYVQGYLPIVMLTVYAQTLAIPGGGGVVLTGPGFVTKDTAASVIDLSSKGIR